VVLLLLNGFPLGACFWQVSKHYREMCGRDEVWKFRGEEKELLLMRKAAAAADSGTSCLKPSTNFSTTTASTNERLQATPLIASNQIHFSGDVGILDPYVSHRSPLS
jgi:hypothetical protein